jgi:hypothetical protein
MMENISKIYKRFLIIPGAIGRSHLTRLVLIALELKHQGAGRMPNLIGRINKNANNILPADAGKTVLHAAVPQFKANDMITFINNGPVKNMPNEGKFQKLIFDCEDGVVVVDRSGVQVR